MVTLSSSFTFKQAHSFCLRNRHVLIFELIKCTKIAMKSQLVATSAQQKLHWVAATKITCVREYVELGTERVSLQNHSKTPQVTSFVIRCSMSFESIHYLRSHEFSWANLAKKKLLCQEVWDNILKTGHERLDINSPNKHYNKWMEYSNDSLHAHIKALILYIFFMTWALTLTF